MAFVRRFLSCAGTFFSCSCLVDQGCTDLLRAPLKSSPSLSDTLPPAQYTSAAQIKGQRGINQKELFRKKKRKEEEDQDIRDVASNKLDGYPIFVERTGKGKGGHNERKSVRE